MQQFTISIAATLAASSLVAMRRGCALIVGALLCAGSPAAAEPGFDPRAFRDAVEAPTRIFVLATPHLSGEMEFDTAWLEPLLVRLEGFGPVAIAVEDLSGESLWALAEYQDLYPGVADMFGRTTLQLARAAQAELETSMPAAEAAARKMLAAWPEHPGPPDRRRLSALFLAAGQPSSALVQWLRLSEGERRSGDGITPELADRLSRLLGSRNESFAIAARLAARLGLERVYPIDDHSESDLVLGALEAWIAAEKSPELAAERARSPVPARAPMKDAGTTLAAYRVINSPEHGRRDAKVQWGSRLLATTHADMHRLRVAGWETRNMRMAAHIREMSARYPGRPVLIIVGSAHKPYLDVYLQQMSDVEVIEATEILGGSED